MNALILFCSHFWRIFLLNTEFGLSLLFFQPLKKCVASVVFYEKSAVHLKCFCMSNASVFSGYFQGFLFACFSFLAVWLQRIWVWVYLDLDCLGFPWLLESVDLYLLPKVFNFFLMFFSTILFFPFPFFLFSSHDMKLDLLLMSHRSWRLCSFFPPIIFLLHCLVSIIFIDLSSSSLTVLSVISVLLFR